MQAPGHNPLPHNINRKKHMPVKDYIVTIGL